MRLWQMLAAQAVTSFSPSDLFSGGEFGGWYDPSDLSTLWQDTAGTTPVTASGQSVARIDDKSGNGNHLTQGATALRPIYTTSGGLHWLDFDGFGDILESATLSQTIMDSADGAFMAVAAASDGSEDIFGLLEEVYATDESTRVVLYFDTRSGTKRFANFAPDDSARFLDLDSEIDGSEKCFILNLDGSGGAGYIDNTALSGSLTTTANFSVSTRLSLGRQTVSTNTDLDGKIYGAIIRDKELTSSERENVNTWLGNKAGI